jgi:Mn-dependent DtxR family transcriptional regulator
MKPLTPSQENYLQSIYTRSARGEVRVGALAKELGVSEPSASRAVNGLVKAGLVSHATYGTVELTEEGQRAGAAMVRRAECLNRLLVDLLHMDSAEADGEIHRLEHLLSEEVLRRLEILVEFAGSSEAWVKRLHHRIQTGDNRPVDDGDFRVGATEVHAGSRKTTDPASTD